MRFYNREDELEQLQEWSEQASKGTAHLTTVVGRRRVGKTALLNKTFPQSNTSAASIYLFVSRKQESLLCEEFVEQIRTVLNIPIFGQPARLREVMEILLQFSITTPVTVILDEFQDIQRVNRAFFFRTSGFMGSVQTTKSYASGLLWFFIQPYGPVVSGWT